MKLTINIDGKPLSKCSGSCFWPIRGHINNISEATLMSPFVVGVYYGHKKTDDTSLFLEDFVREGKVLRTTGFEAKNAGLSHLLLLMRLF